MHHTSATPYNLLVPLFMCRCCVFVCRRYVGFNADATLEGSFLAGPEVGFSITWSKQGTSSAIGHGEVAPTTFIQSQTYQKQENAPRAAPGGLVLCKPTSVWGLCGYFVTPRGAQKLADACFPLQLANPEDMDEKSEEWGINIDGTMSKRVKEKKLEAYLVLPPLVTSPNDHSTSDTEKKNTQNGG